ncbi:MAG: efflux RND transporter permease subunit [Lentisphaeria bacterium]|nr:efflux RND transporter permease subunit [Lentisphaeria bacterium]
MRITEFSVRHNVAVLVFCVGITLLGTIAYFSLPRESFPDVEIPIVLVTTFLDGANPTDIEQSVTIPLESQLDGIEGLKEMRSSSTESLSMISLEFHPGVDIQEALGRVRDGVDQAKADISREAEEPSVKEFSVTSIPVLIYHIQGGGNVSLSELYDLAENLEERFRGIPGVLGVDLFGGRDREIIIEVDPDRLHFYHLTLDTVQAILTGSNRNISAGAVDSDTSRVVVRLPGEFKTAAEIFGLVVGFSERGIPVYLRDVATVRYDFADETSRARLYNFQSAEGDPIRDYVVPARSVSLHIKKRTGTNMLRLTEQADEIVADYPLPADVRVVKGLDHSSMVKEMVSDLENGIGTSLILVVVVIFIGLGGRNALLVAAAIPFSLLLSIFILQLRGETLNMMVLFSLILSVGMLVDNAIVIVENIYRHLSMGSSRIKAAIEGTSEVAWPVITSTATTVGAFAPLLFWPDVMGEFMSHLPRTVIVVLLSSLFVALVINPTLAAMFMTLKPGAETDVDPETTRPSYWLVTKYKGGLEFLLNHPAWTLSTTAGLFFLMILLYVTFGAGVEFFPPVDPETATCGVTPPEGVSLTAADRLSQALEARLFGKPGSGYDTPVQNLKYASVVVGLPGSGNGGVFSPDGGPVRVEMEFVDRGLRTQRTTETLSELRRRIEGLGPDGDRVTYPLFGAEFNVFQPEEGPPTGKPVSIEIYGKDLNDMTRVIEDMKQLILSTPGTVKPSDDAVTARPTLEWRVDFGKAGMVGLEQATVGAFMEMAVGGLKTGTFGHGDDEQDIRLQFPENVARDTAKLMNVTVPTRAGGAVPLGAVAAAELLPGPVTITHVDKRRVLTASADLQPDVRRDADVRKDFQSRVADYPFPPGITYEFGGAAEEQNAASSFLTKAFIAAVFIIVLVMVIQFNSISVTGIVMVSVLLSLIGVFFGLLVTNAPFGIIMTGIGVISLAGVVVNNAIVLLDAIRQLERGGTSTRDAIVSAAMIRFRPVLLTAITTILGLLPMALKLNWDFRQFTFQYDTSSSQWWQSMATAVIFGLLVATMLTLGVVPTLYELYAWYREKTSRWLPRH